MAANVLCICLHRRPAIAQWGLEFRLAFQTELFKVNSLLGKITILSHFILRPFFIVNSIFLSNHFIALCVSETRMKLLYPFALMLLAVELRKDESLM